MAILKPKKVELIELFYDLLFVCAYTNDVITFIIKFQTVKQETTFIPFIRYFVIIGLVLMQQYLYEYLRSTKKEDRNLTLKFIFIVILNNNITPFL